MIGISKYIYIYGNSKPQDKNTYFITLMCAFVIFVICGKYLPQLFDKIIIYTISLPMW